MSIIKILKVVLSGLPQTLLILIISFILSSLIGLFVMWLGLQDDKISRGIVHLYINLSRGTPPLLMLLLSYYEFPEMMQFIGINANDWSKDLFAVLGLAIGFGGYMGEVFRSAFQSVDIDQFEAGYSVGMKRHDVLRKIIFPQMLTIALPNIQNMFLNFLKATSLVYVIGIADMYRNATTLANDNQGVFQMEIFIVLGIVYWLITLLFDAGFNFYKRKHNYI